MDSNRISEAPLLLGKHLQDLAKKLIKNDSHVSWLLGLTINRWYQITDDGSRRKRNPNHKHSTPKDEKDFRGNQVLLPRHAIMARFLFNNPEFAYTATFEDLLIELDSIDNSITHRDLAIMLGLEPSAAERVVQNNGTLSPTATNMINIIYINLKLAANKDERLEILHKLRLNVDLEAEARGIPHGKIWENGGWSRLATREEVKQAAKYQSKDEEDE